jgi:class 3 adenylate cyclase
MSACPSCGHDNPAGARFCNDCGVPLVGEAPVSREERKRVTVVFCDLAGFTARAEQMDPEDVRAVLAPYHAHVRDELERHGGTVEKFIGDAVMAVFGAPSAHEDDPERAVRAALSIRDWAVARRDLQVRLAVHTGDALVSLGADPGEGEAMVAGDVVNTAARMQAAAPVGGVLVGGATCEATQHAIDYRAAAPIEAKGKREPIEVREALRPLSPHGIGIARHGSAPLTGRDRELDVLRSLLARVRDEHTSQLVTVVGVPGIGKSRLVHELQQSPEADPVATAWRQGRCLPYGEAVAFWALGQIVKGEAAILETDTTEQAEAKLSGAVAAVVHDPRERRWLGRELRPLAGLPSGEGGGGEESAAAWRRFLEALAERGPVVLVLEDVHWAGDHLLDFLDGLVEWVLDVPLLVICTARPELLERRAAWGGGKANATTISLQPLGDEDMARLVGGLAAQEGGLVDDGGLLVERAGGNPLVAEQYVRMARERGTLDSLPESVHGVMAARVDGLPQAEKDLLQDAAVRGRVFWLGAVAAELGLSPQEATRLLLTLERKGFVRRERRSVVEGDTQYAFTHALLRDVAYGQIPRLARSEKHRRAAAWIEGLGGADDHVEMVAHHYREALALTRAAGQTDDPDLVQRARTAVQGAGERSLTMSSYAAAEEEFTDALALATPEDPERARLLLGLGRAVFARGGTGRTALGEALERFLAAGDAEGAAETATLLARFAFVEGDPAEAVRLNTLAVDALVDLPDSPALAVALAHRCTLEMLTGDLEAAIRTGREARPLVERLGRDDLRARVAFGVGSARCYLGDQSGLDDLEASVSIAWEGRALETLILCYYNLSAVQFLLGRLGASQESVARCHELVDRYGLTRWRRVNLMHAASAAFMYGRWSDALGICDALLAENSEGARYAVDPEVHALRTVILLGRGDAAGADAASRQALDLAGGSGVDAQAAALHARAILHLAAGRVADAGREASRLAAFGRRLLPAVSAPALTLADVAWVLAETGRSADLAGMLASVRIASPWMDAARAIAEGDPVLAAETLEQLGHPAGVARARLHAAEALAAAGRDTGAREQARRAAAFYRTAGASAFVRRAEEAARRTSAVPFDG